MQKCLKCGKETKNPKFCNRSCTASYNNKVGIEDRFCKNCGILLVNSHKTKFCTHICATEYMKKLSVKNWLNGTRKSNFINDAIRNYILDSFGNKCSFCETGNIWQGKPLSLHIDHIDGNWKNNLPNNLRVLCPNCHAQTETFGIKNRGKGREFQREHKRNSIRK